MASCAIVIGGSTGSVRLRWLLGSNPYDEIAYPGDPIFIDDSATEVTWENLGGDADASSGCVTITEITPICYEFLWDVELSKPGCNGLVYYGITNLKIDALILDGDIGSPIEIAPVAFDEFRGDGLLGESINALDNDYIKMTWRKTVTTGSMKEISYIMSITSGEVPSLRITSTKEGDDTIFYLIPSGTASCTPSGYTAVAPCATTSTIAPL